MATDLTNIVLIYYDWQSFYVVIILDLLLFKVQFPVFAFLVKLDYLLLCSLILFSGGLISQLTCLYYKVLRLVNSQRFYEHGGEMQIAHDAPLRPSMDIFAVG